MNFPWNKGTEIPPVIQTRFPLCELEGKSVEVSHTGPDVSSNGGLLLLREVDEQMGLLPDLAFCLTDNRHQSYVDHSHLSLFRQRVFQIMAGYEDANDCDSLRTDGILKMCVGNLPQSGADLASQPTMSRFENSVSQPDLYRLGECIVSHFVKSYDSEPLVIILDCDDTNHTAHGNQEGIEYNGYYGEYCFMPFHLYEGLSGKLITTVLKPGRRSKGADVFSLLQRVISLLRESWPNTRIIIRGDSHFCSPQLMDWSASDSKVNFITGLSGNSRLNKLSETTIESAKRSFARTGQAVTSYHTFRYKAGSWSDEQRVIVKVEVNQKGTNIRYIVTDLWEYRTRNLYTIGYCARGAMELRIKEHKTYLLSGRSSCHRFESNQFRLFLHSAAYILLHSLQKQVLKGTEFVNSTMKTLQLKLIKVAALISEKKTKIKVEYPQSCPVAQIQGKAFRIFEVLRL